MKNKLIYGIFVFLISIFILSQVVFKDALAKDKSTWEYTTLTGGTYPADNAFVDNLNKLGAEGWELVAIQQPNEQGGNYYYVFKRAK